MYKSEEEKKMKKFISILCVVLCLCLFAPIRGVADTSVPYDDNNWTVSEVMTYDEMVNYYALRNNISFEEAVEELQLSNKSATTRSTNATYRTLSVRFNVKDSYSPSIDFYCETSEYGNYWGILNIYSIQMNRYSNGITKQFSGVIDAWLRSPYQIEYVINGDFYNNGSTTVSGGAGFTAEINQQITVTFNASMAYSSNWYAYCYKHYTHAFQS